MYVLDNPSIIAYTVSFYIFSIFFLYIFIIFSFIYLIYLLTYLSFNFSLTMKSNFKHFKHLIIVTALSTLSVACAQNDTNATTVNGKPISNAVVNFVIKQQEQSQMQNGEPAIKITPEQRKELINRMIDMEVLAQDAAKNKLGGKDLEIELALAKTQLLVRAAIKSFKEKNPISDADAKAEYDKQIANLGNKEYQARHILLDNEEQAKEVIAKLKAGESFESQVKLSKDTGSVEQGGDLGFAMAGNYVKPFADALTSLKKGELTAEPVKTEYGFHVIELIDVRDATPPAFDEVSAQIKEGLLAQKIEAYQKELRKAAVIK
jgi:peptidyl-prolyl cis-trans isomerase C